MKDDPILRFENDAAWAKWLATHHGDPTGVWLKIAKKAAKGKKAMATVSYQEALGIALCFGWIDGQKGRFDDHYYLQRFTHRRPRSIWSRINREKAEALLAAGLMREPGLREIEAAKADGRWEAAYESQSRATVPPDLAAALADAPEARVFFEALNAVNRYAIIFRINSAKQLKTRKKRIAAFVAMLENGEKIYD